MTSHARVSVGPPEGSGRLARPRTARLSGGGWRAVGLAAALLSAACPREEVPEARHDGEPESPTEALRAEAQQEALQRLAPLVAELAALEDPLTATLRDEVAPRMPPVAPADRAPLRAALEVAVREADGLLPRMLAPADRVVASGSLFTINRVRDALRRTSPWVDDPTWVTHEAALLVRALETQTRGSGQCTWCEEGLKHMATSLDAAGASLRNVPEARANAAAADARALAARIEQLPAETSHVAAALVRFAESSESAAMEKSSRWGSDVLRRVLEVEENVGRSPEDLFTGMGSAVATLSAMSSKRPPPGSATPGAVTNQRCADAWAELDAVFTAQPALAPGDFDCARFTSGVGRTAMTDVELQIALVDLTIVHPLRVGAQRALPPVLSGIGGRVARSSQAHTLRTAVLLGAPQLEDAAARALYDELDAACLAAASLWVHGELGNDDALAERLSAYCPRPTPAYIDDALARPRQSLGGLALARVPHGPAGGVPLDKLWWLPLGLIDDVALPEAPRAPSPVRAVVEPLSATAPPAP